MRMIAYRDQASCPSARPCLRGTEMTSRSCRCSARAVRRHFLMADHHMDSAITSTYGAGPAGDDRGTIIDSTSCRGAHGTKVVIGCFHTFLRDPRAHGHGDSMPWHVRRSPEHGTTNGPWRTCCAPGPAIHDQIPEDSRVRCFAREKSSLVCLTRRATCAPSRSLIINQGGVKNIACGCVASSGTGLSAGI